MDIMGEKNCREIVYIKEKDQIAVGYQNGMIVFYNNSN